VTFEVDAHDADVTAYEPIFIDGQVLGFCTSGGFSHHTQKSIAFGLIPKEHVKEPIPFLTPTAAVCGDNLV